MVILALSAGTSGKNFFSESVILIFPCSTSFMAAVAVNALVMEPMHAKVLVVNGSFASLMAQPYPFEKITVPFLTIVSPPENPFSFSSEVMYWSTFLAVSPINMMLLVSTGAALSVVCWLQLGRLQQMPIARKRIWRERFIT